MAGLKPDTEHLESDWTGRDLYVMYGHEQEKLNDCSVDPWESLDASEQAVWDAMAQRVN